MTPSPRGATSAENIQSGMFNPPRTKPTRNSLLYRGLDVEGPLKPDPGTDMNFEVEKDKFPFSPGQLHKLLYPKSPAAFQALDGLFGQEKGLRTELPCGLSLDETRIDGIISFEKATENPDFSAKAKSVGPSYCFGTDEVFADRKRVSGDNRPPHLWAKSFWGVFWTRSNSNALVLLILATIVSVLTLARGFNTRLPIITGPLWIMEVIVALSEWQKDRAFVKRKLKKYEPKVILVDGISIQGYNIKSNKSQKAGKSNIVKHLKHFTWEVNRAMTNHTGITLSNLDPFMISGAKAPEGGGTLLVTATGVHSSYGRTGMLLNDVRRVNQSHTRNVVKLGIAGFGILVAIGMFAQLKKAGIVDKALTYFLLLPAYVFTNVVVLKTRNPVPVLTQAALKLLGLTPPRRLLPGPLFQHGQIRKTNSVTLPLIIGKERLNSIPDTGADENVISTACALQLGLTIAPDPDRVTFRLANGRCVKSSGIIRTSVAFAKGKKRCEVQTVFRVLPTLAVPIIMGRKFLKDTKTLSKYDDRLERPVSPLLSAIPRVFHLESPRQRLRCRLDGIPVYAHADTGAEMNLVSPKWAAKHKMVIRKPDRGYEQVILADGSLARISGQVSVRFELYKKSRKQCPYRVYTREFFILDGLTSDALLGQDLLMDIRAFKDQQDAFIELNDASSFSDLNNITWLSRREKKFRSLFTSLFKREPPRKQKAPDPEISFREKMDWDTAREQHRHRKALSEITRLPDRERPSRLTLESQQHARFLQDRDERERVHRSIMAGVVQQSTATGVSSTTS